ncbi:hypothetical protein BQ8482_960001 [Mesorhizobium delmotii]|uniref:Uncharacterized protein n=1 Tax=Mesorhizobium delmotii TaxID=1631247 RepID=A0A2P9AXW9_9HYPH|nr:hypothetical protein BQ8482_960001 [Mesorhizobium delmotii]
MIQRDFCALGAGAGANVPSLRDRPDVFGAEPMRAAWTLPHRHGARQVASIHRGRCNSI